MRTATATIPAKCRACPSVPSSTCRRKPRPLNRLLPPEAASIGHSGPRRTPPTSAPSSVRKRRGEWDSAAIRADASASSAQASILQTYASEWRGTSSRGGGTRRAECVDRGTGGGGHSLVCEQAQMGQPVEDRRTASAVRQRDVLVGEPSSERFEGLGGGDVHVCHRFEVEYEMLHLPGRNSVDRVLHRVREHGAVGEEERSRETDDDNT